MWRTRHDHLHGSARVNEGPESEGAQRYPFIQKRLWQAVSPRPHLPIMVLLHSDSLKPSVQLGEILGGVQDPWSGSQPPLFEIAHWLGE